VIFVDEMNDVMMTMKKEVEGHIIRLAQKSRAAGIHLVVATQKPTVDVITGLIKSNLPARTCFQVSSRSDSRVVLDEMGADKLLGKGDMLFLQPGTSTLIRAQGTYASDEEITRGVEPCFAEELVQLKGSGDGKGGFLEALRARDELYEPAVEIVIREQRGSVSLLQRALGIGYGKAARFIDYMAEDGIVGPYNGSNARQVLVTPDEWESRKKTAGGVNYELPERASSAAPGSTCLLAGCNSNAHGVVVASLRASPARANSNACGSTGRPGTLPTASRLRMWYWMRLDRVWSAAQLTPSSTSHFCARTWLWWPKCDWVTTR